MPNCPGDSASLKAENARKGISATIDPATRRRIGAIKKHLLGRGQSAYQHLSTRDGARGRASEVPIGALLADIVMWVYQNPSRKRELEKFYDTSYKSSRASASTLLKMTWPVSADYALLAIALEVLATNNKSEMLRVLVAFAAKRRYKLED